MVARELLLDFFIPRPGHCLDGVESDERGQGTGGPGGVPHRGPVPVNVLSCGEPRVDHPNTEEKGDKRGVANKPIWTVERGLADGRLN